MSSDSHTTLTAYSSNWNNSYLQEAQKLSKLFGLKALNIAHIGSTSIEGLDSKPIIDLALVVEYFEPANIFTSMLADSGYTFHSSSTERHFYTKGNPISHHLSIAFAHQGGFWVRQIIFRDYLRTHKEAREAYTALKKQLLIEDPTGVNSYIPGKSSFVEEILNKAGWKPNQLYSQYDSHTL